MRTGTTEGSRTPANNNHVQLVIDLSEYHDAPTLLLVCRGCGGVFQSDWEERWCARCVHNREVLGLNVPDVQR